jgi:hypothetical protein
MNNIKGLPMNGIDDTKVAKMLLTAPDEVLDSAMKDLIGKWSNPPLPLEVLEVLDQCVNGGLASILIILILDQMFADSCLRSGCTQDSVYGAATWRKE